MARPIWTGTLSFGLLNVPVSLMSGERRVDISFRMLDSRDRKPIRFERVNAETGEEVPWKDIVKAFEYDKGSYVVVEKEDIASAAPQTHDSIDVEAFVERGEISLRFYEKPYVIVPGKKAEKGYVLLRETLRDTGRAGIARVVIRTREYLCAVVPEGEALLLMMLRYPQELVDPAEYRLPGGKPADYRISRRETEMAASLIESMSVPWRADDYQDEFRGRLEAIIRKRLKAKGATTRIIDEHAEAEDATTNVVDFMALLQKSLEENKRTPAGKRKPAKKAAPRRSAAKKAGTSTRRKAAP
ncbi:Ku protein [Stenotrophomonas acidaminiphila]|uniref:non-homologous end joining protein Ku n=1 Tax=Stenotrophomonas acidaminiphila TaxID=128780 RepID=UPI001FAEBA0C|nr:Ku protein [Stenotrophomonas acidaminiphila]